MNKWYTIYISRLTLPGVMANVERFWRSLMTVVQGPKEPRLAPQPIYLVIVSKPRDPRSRF